MAPLIVRSARRRQSTDKETFSDFCSLLKPFCPARRCQMPAPCPVQRCRSVALQDAVRTAIVVVPRPLRDLLQRIGQIAEPVLVQAFVTKSPVETGHVAVLRRRG
jgi:hypothetical protein